MERKRRQISLICRLGHCCSICKSKRVHGKSYVSVRSTLRAYWVCGGLWAIERSNENVVGRRSAVTWLTIQMDYVRIGGKSLRAFMGYSPGFLLVTKSTRIRSYFLYSCKSRCDTFNFSRFSLPCLRKWKSSLTKKGSFLRWLMALRHLWLHLWIGELYIHRKSDILWPKMSFWRNFIRSKCRDVIWNELREFSALGWCASEANCRACWVSASGAEGERIKWQWKRVY